jgi:hypothetical protein
MATTSSFSTFVRPPGSPIYSPSGPSLVLPRRSYPSIRAQHGAAGLRDATIAEARRQIAEILALIQAAEEQEKPGAIINAQNEEMARSLAQLELTLLEREQLAEEREFRVAERERDLAEAEALVQYREALLNASKKTPPARPGLSEEERFALVNLKAELDRQEELLREAREALREREKFVEESECRLFEKVQDQQEKETELEQLEEELNSREAAIAAGGAQGSGATPIAAPKRILDEFNE